MHFKEIDEVNFFAYYWTELNEEEKELIADQVLNKKEKIEGVDEQVVERIITAWRSEKTRDEDL